MAAVILNESGCSVSLILMEERTVKEMMEDISKQKSVQHQKH